MNSSSFPRIKMLSAISLGLLLAGCGGGSGGTTPPVEPPSVVDSDNDGVVDSLDAFPQDPNETIDTDSDGIGDNADTDDDGDGVADSEDAFPLDPSETLDTDGDGMGNNVDVDDDDDGVADSEDVFPLDPTETIDTDGDGIGNNADVDDDGDGVNDSEDAFPLDPSESLDTDDDGIGNNADLDDDGDGVADSEDAFPLDPTETIDTDGDGIGNNADLDDDGDGVADSEDAFPLDPSESLDTDGDGIGNNADLDDDGDGVADSEDAFPLDPTETIDTDGDGIGNNADLDDDGDGVNDDEDLYPLDPTEWADSDGDGVGNNADVAPFSALCWEQSQGADGACYRELMTQRDVDSSLYAISGGELFYYYLPVQKQVIGFNLITQRIDWVFSSERIANDDSIDISAMTYAQDQQKLYVAYSDNWVESVDISAATVTPLYQSNARAIKLVDVGERVFFVDNFNQAGFIAADGTTTIVDGEDWSNRALDMVYSQKHNKLYYLYYGILYSAIVDERTWQITATNAITPSHSFYSGKLRLSPSEDLLSYDNVSQILRLADEKWMSRMSFNDFGSKGFWLANDHYLLTHAVTSDEGATLSRFDYQQSESFDYYQPVMKQTDLWVDSTPMFTVNYGDSAYVLVTQEGAFTSVPYIINNDSDGDGVENEHDAFPNDAGASIDSDNDGYADVVAEPSQLIQDAFPNDAGCYLAEHGVNGACDPILSMNSYEPHVIGVYDDIVYLRDGYSSTINRWSMANQTYLNPLLLDQGGYTFIRDIALSKSTGHLYTLYQNGLTYQMDLKEQQGQNQPFNYHYLANTLQVADQCLLLADDKLMTSFDHRGNTYGQTATPVNFRNATRIWHSDNQKLYLEQKALDNNRLMWVGVTQQDCELSMLLSDETIDFATPHETVSAIREDGQQLFTRSNKVYNSQTLVSEGTLVGSGGDQPVYWQNRFMFDLAEHTQDSFKLKVNDTELFRSFAEFNFAGAYLFAEADSNQIEFYTFDGLRLTRQSVDIADTDGDGMPSWWELYNGLDPNNTSDALADADGDGVNNLSEFNAYTSPTQVDTDGDGLSDYVELVELGSNALNRDSDGDGINDDWEVLYQLNIAVNDADIDSDGDGYSNYQEYLANSDPTTGQSLPQQFTTLSYDFEDQQIPANWRFEHQQLDYPKVEFVDLGTDTTNYALRLPRGLKVSFSGNFSGHQATFDIQCASQHSGRLYLYHDQFSEQDWSQSHYIPLNSAGVWHSKTHTVPEGFQTITFFNASNECDLYIDNLQFKPLAPLIGSEVHHVTNFYDRLRYFDKEHNEIRVDKLVINEDWPTFLLDQVVTSDGKIVIYEPHAGESLLLHYDPETMNKRHIRSEYFNSFEHRFGGLATHGDYVYATTVQDPSGNGHKGIVRFNLKDNTSELFGDENYRDIAIHISANGNGILAAAINNRVDIFDLQTMEYLTLVGTRGDDVPIDAIAVGPYPYRHIYASFADNSLRHHEFGTGEIISIADFPERIFDIDLDAEGNVLVTTESFKVYKLNSELEILSSNEKTNQSSGLAIVPKQ